MSCVSLYSSLPRLSSHVATTGSFAASLVFPFPEYSIIGVSLFQTNVFRLAVYIWGFLSLLMGFPGG